MRSTLLRVAAGTAVALTLAWPAATAAQPSCGDVRVVRHHRGPSLRVDASTARAGERVTLTALGFEPGARLHVGFGPVRSEYEVIEEGRAEADGSMRAVVPVPEWAEAGRRYVFVVETADHAAKAISPPLRIVPAGTDRGEPPPGGAVVTLTGRLTDEGVECPAFRADDGTLYTLVGDLEGHVAGDRVRVVVAPVEASFCMQGTTVSIREIEPAGDGGWSPAPRSPSKGRYGFP